MEILKNGELKSQIRDYWGKRAHDFSALRKHELHSPMAEKWEEEILPFIPENRDIQILDIGTGSGFFAVLLAKIGYRNVTGIDLTENMIREARETARMEEPQVQPTFLVMDAENTDFPDENFDLILTRNLTWTLPHMSDAYREWYRILKRGGLLLNFDGNYGEEDEKEEKLLPKEHAHKNLREDLKLQHRRITESLPGSHMKRPASDLQMLQDCGFSKITVDFGLSGRIYKEVDEFYNPVPMFALQCRKR